MKLYSEVSDPEIEDICATWDQGGRLGRHLILWLADNGYSWDPTLTDAQNRTEFEKVDQRVRDCLWGYRKEADQ